MRIVELLVGNRQDGDLHRRQPGWQGARIMLEEECDSTLQAAQRRAMNDPRTLLGTILGDVRQIETLTHLQIDLVGEQRLLASSGRAHLHIELWAVKGGFALPDLVVELEFVSDLDQACLRKPPVLGIVDVFVAVLVPERNAIRAVLVDAEAFHDVIDEIDHLLEHTLELPRLDKDMRVRQMERQHPDQTTERPRMLLAEQRRYLRCSARSIR